MTKVTKLEAFCLMAESQQQAAAAGLLDASKVDWTFSLSDMISVSAEIRELQRKAEAADVPSVPLLDGDRLSIVLEAVTVKPAGVAAPFQTYSFSGTPVRVSGRLARVQEPASAGVADVASGAAFPGRLSVTVTGAGGGGGGKYGTGGAVGGAAKPGVSIDATHHPKVPTSGMDADGGWIAWTGGKCPVPASVLVDVKWRGGAHWRACPASTFGWEHDYGINDIIAYRVRGDA
jgi:hypothetical protein